MASVGRGVLGTSAENTDDCKGFMIVFKAREGIFSLLGNDDTLLKEPLCMDVKADHM